MCRFGVQKRQIQCLRGLAKGSGKDPPIAGLRVARAAE